MLLQVEQLVAEAKVALVEYTEANAVDAEKKAGLSALQSQVASAEAEVAVSSGVASGKKAAVTAKLAEVNAAIAEVLSQLS